MDEESLRAVERDGRKGWVDGPCLWLDHKRFAVGSANGNLRRPDSEIAALKPVVYAADKTEEPVHPEAAAKPKAEKPVMAPEKYTVAIGEADTPLKTASHTAASVDPSYPTVSYQNVQDGAEMDTQANKPDPELTHAKSAEQAKNAETRLPVDNAAPLEAGGAPAAAGPGHAMKVSDQMNMNETLIHDVTTTKMQDESISLIPSNANGSAHHDDFLVASDPTKGLVLETEKLNMNGDVKPPMERFVTAVDEITTLSGQA
jgi:hypothetical protein